MIWKEQPHGHGVQSEMPNGLYTVNDASRMGFFGCAGRFLPRWRRPPPGMGRFKDAINLGNVSTMEQCKALCEQHYQAASIGSSR